MKRSKCIQSDGSAVIQPEAIPDLGPGEIFEARSPGDRTAEEAISRGAYHEAGHAVASFAHGLAIDSVELIVDEETGWPLGGRTAILKPLVDARVVPTDERAYRAWKRRILRQLEILAAGGVGEAFARPELSDHGRLVFVQGGNGRTDLEVGIPLARRLLIAETGRSRPSQTEVIGVIFEAAARFQRRLLRDPGNLWAINDLADRLASHWYVNGRNARVIWARARQNYREAKAKEARCRAARKCRR